jgi:hypothetical protein
MVDVSVRHAEPDDTRSVHRILSGPQAIVGTTQLPPSRSRASASASSSRHAKGSTVWWSVWARDEQGRW